MPGISPVEILTDRFGDPVADAIAQSIADIEIFP
jgi:hypothetical protein